MDRESNSRHLVFDKQLPSEFADYDLMKDLLLQEQADQHQAKHNL